MNELRPLLPDKNVILSHDWLTGMRGGEHVLELMCRLFPNAPLYTLIYEPERISGEITKHYITSSWLQNLPGVQRYYRYLLPLFPAVVRSLKPDNADLLVSTSHCVAKALPAPKGTPHLCYCFTPMRYAWGFFYEEYFGKSRLKRRALQPLLARLREWDKKTAQMVTHFVTTSRYVRERIKRCYGREADVVHPPVNTDLFTPDPQGSSGNIRGADLGSYDLIVSALVPYKRVELAVKAYSYLGWPLVVVGTGPEYNRLRKMAKNNITFTGWISDKQLRKYYRHCRCLVFPAEEEFGIVPLEAQACGRPVVAFNKGGALETIEEGSTGIFFREPEENALLGAVEQFASRSWEPKTIRLHAEKFNPSRFCRGIEKAVKKCM